MKNLWKLYLLGTIIFVSACSVEPVPIEYGKDACHFCKMNIVDKQHAAEYVTKKAKAYKFDAVECLLNELKTKNMDDIQLILVNTYDKPGNFAIAEQSTYLISENLPSPMGAFITAFENKETAIAVQKEKEGNIYKWQALISTFYKNK